MARTSVCRCDLWPARLGGWCETPPGALGEGPRSGFAGCGGENQPVVAAIGQPAGQALRSIQIEPSLAIERNGKATANNPDWKDAYDKVVNAVSLDHNYASDKDKSTKFIEKKGAPDEKKEFDASLKALKAQLPPPTSKVSK